MKKIVRLSESELVQVIKKVIFEQSLKTPEQDAEFLKWVKNATVTPFIAPNPYRGGDLKLGVQIKSNDGTKLSPLDLSNPNQSKTINLIDRLDITTEDGKVVYSLGNKAQDGSGNSLFNSTTFRPRYEVIDNSYVVYSLVPEDSDLIQKLKQFIKPNKVNKFIVTVTPRLSNDLMKTGSKLFVTKPNILMVSSF